MTLAPRSDFPLLAGNPDLCYLDTAATSQKPRAVLEAMQRYYEQDNANPHRGAYALSVRATDTYHHARQRIARFLGAADPALLAANTQPGLHSSKFAPLPEPTIKTGVTALTVSLAPALVFTTEFVWSESLVQALYLGAVADWLRDRVHLSRAVALSIAVVSTLATQSRSALSVVENASSPIASPPPKSSTIPQSIFSACSQVSVNGASTSPKTRKSHVVRSTFGTEP